MGYQGRGVLGLNKKILGFYRAYYGMFRGRIKLSEHGIPERLEVWGMDTAETHEGCCPWASVIRNSIRLFMLFVFMWPPVKVLPSCLCWSVCGQACLYSCVCVCIFLWLLGNCGQPCYWLDLKMGVKTSCWSQPDREGRNPLGPAVHQIHLPLTSLWIVCAPSTEQNLVLAPEILLSKSKL